jgi:hypothetical protein
MMARTASRARMMGYWQCCLSGGLSLSAVILFIVTVSPVLFSSTLICTLVSATVGEVFSVDTSASRVEAISIEELFYLLGTLAIAGWEVQMKRKW